MAASMWSTASAPSTPLQRVVATSQGGKAGGPAKRSMGLQFAFGGLSGIGATCIVQPIDLIKTRLQLAGAAEAGKAAAGAPKGDWQAVRAIVQQQGIRGMYTGLSSALMRQATYTTTRMGMFQFLKGKLQSEGEEVLPLYKKALAGLGAGATGAIVGNPAEISMIRMMADGRLPADQRRNYKHVGDAFLRISREEGVATLWRGCGPTIARAMLLNMAQLASYDQAKQMLLGSGYFQENFALHLVASTFSGFIATTVSMPADMAKTRLQDMKTAPGEVPMYSGTVDVITKVIRNEGVLALWKGFLPYFLRLGQHTIYTFIFFEQLNKLADRS